jgi:hypothetical protein
VGASEEDAFTRSSGYLFEEGLSAEGELPTAYDISGIAAVYRRRPLLVLRRSLQIGASFGRWFALRYLDGVNERTDDMFEVGTPRVTLTHSSLLVWSSALAQHARLLFDYIPSRWLAHGMVWWCCCRSGLLS